MAQDDFFDLARIAKPTMMPNAPIGAGWGAGVDYGQQQLRQNSYLDNAAGLAGLRAQMEAMKANEEAMGAPGRESDIAVKNALAQSALNDVGTTTATAGAKRQADLSGAKAKGEENAVAELGPAINAWDKADEAQKGQWKALFKARGTQYQGMKLGEMSDGDLDSMMTSLRNAQANNPKFMLESYKADKKYDASIATVKSRKEIADNHNQIMLQLKKMGIDSQQKLQNAQTQIELKAKNQGWESLTDAERDTYKTIQDYKVYSRIAALTAGQPQVNPAIAPGVLQPPQVPSPPSLPAGKPKDVSEAAPTPSSGEVAKVTPVYSVGDTYQGKKVTRTGKDKTGATVLQLSDGKQVRIGQ